MDYREKQRNLEERTTKFAEKVVLLVRSIPQDSVNKRIIEQIVGSSGSIGANYMEATECESKKDFVHKIGICKKEIKETQYWLKILLKENENISKEIEPLWNENHELLLIFSKIISTCKKY